MQSEPLLSSFKEYNAAKGALKKITKTLHKFVEALAKVFRFGHNSCGIQQELSTVFLSSLLDSLKLRKPSVLQCLEKGETRGEIQSDVEGSIRAGAQSTPTFYIEGGLMLGAQPVGVFRAVLDSIIATKKKTP